MVAGRPRTTSFSPEEMIALGEEMVDWVMQNNPLHLKQWYSIEKGILYKDWKAMIQLSEFLPYYEQAVNYVSLQYLDKTSNIRDSVSHRFLRIYFKDVREEEDETAAYLERLKSDEAHKVDEAVAEGMEAVLKLMKARQSSARKADDSSNSNDRKSD